MEEIKIIPISSRYSTKPDDWDDNEKYTDRELVYESPKADFCRNPEKETTEYPCYGMKDSQGSNDMFDADAPCYHFHKFKKLYYRYRDPKYSDPQNITIVQCPNCGSFDISITDTNNLNPGSLSGMKGTMMQCKHCNFFDMETNIQS